MGVIEELAAKDAARQALGRAKQAEMGRVMNQGEQGLAATVADPYVSGISQEDLHKLALVKQAQDANTSKAVMDMVAKNQAYQANKKDAEMFGDKVGPDGKYKLLSDAQVLSANAEPAWDLQEGPTGDDPISLGLRKLQKYLINTPREAANEYIDNVDPGLAAKWMSSYKGR